MALCWGASVVIVFCLYATFYVFGSSRYAHQHFDLEITKLSSRTVAIGSSITGQAFPPVVSNEDSSSLKGITRWVVPGIGLGDSIHLLESAVEQDIDRILIEAGPLLRIVHVGDPNRYLLRALLTTAKNAKFGLKIVLETNVGRLPNSPNLYKEYDPELMQLAFRPAEDFREGVSYSFLDWKNSTEIEVLIDQARSRDIAIVLLSYPRAKSSTQTSYHQADLELLREEIRRFAQHYSLAYFSPDLLWDDAFFTDRSHFNAMGRERYLREIEDWWAAR